MANLTIKNIPNDLHAHLRQAAMQHRRSINGEVIVCLERALHSLNINTHAILTNARRLRQRTFRYQLTDKKLSKIKNEGRP